MFIHGVADVLRMSWHDYQHMANEAQRPWLEGVISSCGASVTLAATRQDRNLDAWTSVLPRRDVIAASLWKQLRTLRTQREAEEADATGDWLTQQLITIVSETVH